MSDTAPTENAPTGGRRSLTRSEAARHASLVRWGKEQPFAARLARIRSARKGRKAKATPESRAAARAALQAKNRAAVGAALDNADDPAMSARGLAALDAARNGQEPPAGMADGMIRGGFAERGADGHLRLTAEGRALMHAADRGDINAAHDAISRASDRAAANDKREQAKAEKEKKGKGGGGGGKGKKDKPDKDAAKEQARRQHVADTAHAVGLGADDAEALRTAADAGGARNPALLRLGLIDANGDATPQGRRALSGLERGSASQYRAAVLSARAQAGRAADRQSRAATRDRAKAERQTQAAQRSRGRPTARTSRTTKPTPQQAELFAKKDADMDYTAILDTLTTACDTLLEDAESAVKAGRRNSTDDQATINQGYELAMQLCDLFEALGADTGEEDADMSAGMPPDDEQVEMEGKAVPITGVWLEGMRDNVSVLVEIEGAWKRLVTEQIDLSGEWAISHIIEPEGIRDAPIDTSPKVIGKHKIIAARKQEIDKPVSPNADTKDIELSSFVGGAVKMADDDTIFGPAIWLGGSPNDHDLTKWRDYFTKSTDFWLDKWDRRPMLWHHALDEGDIIDEMRAGGAGTDEIKAMREALDYLKANPVIGTWTKAVADPVAVWLQGQLDKAHRYRSAVKHLVDRGLIKISTDSAPHLVVRERKPNGAHEIKRWPLITGSLTASAAEPRLFDVQAIKSLYAAAGTHPPFAIYDDDPQAHGAADSQRADGLQAAAAERARWLLLQSRIVTLQE